LQSLVGFHHRIDAINGQGHREPELSAIRCTDWLGKHLSPFKGYIAGLTPLPSALSIDPTLTNKEEL